MNHNRYRRVGLDLGVQRCAAGAAVVVGDIVGAVEDGVGVGRW